MNKTGLFTTAFVLGICATASAGGKDDKSVTDLKTANQKMLDSWMNEDETAFKAGLGEQIWGAWDLDMMGRPAEWATSADVIKMYEQMMAAMKAMGAKGKATVTKNDCHASGDMGVCMMEATMSMEMPNMPPMSMAVRSTDVFWKAKGMWKAVHHHASLAKAPDMPPNFMSMTAATAKMMPVPGMTGVMFSPVWMNPVTQSMVALMKIGKDGMKQTKHMHPAAYAFYVVDGAVITTDGAGKDTTFGPGSIVYRPAGGFHQTSVKPNSTIFMVTDGPLTALDEAGKPVPSTPITAKK